jgi:hypothetical protein
MQIRDVEDGGHGIRLDIDVRSGREDEIREMRRDVRRQRR